jgi:DNA topoisomerase VI subunit B
VGFGDVKLKVNWIFYQIAVFGMSASVEFGFPTSTNLILGSGVYTLTPKLLFSFQLPLKFQLVISYRGTFDYAKRWSDADDIHEGLIKTAVVWNKENDAFWVILEPRITIDYENGGDPYMAITATYGHRLYKGLSFYIEPGVGIGANIAEDPDAGLFRPYNWYLETGLKWVFGFFGS